MAVITCSSVGFSPVPFSLSIGSSTSFGGLNVEMHVGVIDARDHRAAAEIDGPCGGPPQSASIFAESPVARIRSPWIANAST
jgi:hypothetical protein